MHVFEIIIALLLVGAGLTALSRRIGIPYPALLALDLEELHLRGFISQR